MGFLSWPTPSSPRQQPLAHTAPDQGAQVVDGMPRAAATGRSSPQWTYAVQDEACHAPLQAPSADATAAATAPSTLPTSGITPAGSDTVGNTGKRGASHAPTRSITLTHISSRGSSTAHDGASPTSPPQARLTSSVVNDGEASASGASTPTGRKSMKLTKLFKKGARLLGDMLAPTSPKQTSQTSPVRSKPPHKDCDEAGLWAEGSQSGPGGLVGRPLGRTWLSRASKSRKQQQRLQTLLVDPHHAQYFHSMGGRPKPGSVGLSGNHQAQLPIRILCPCCGTDVSHLLAHPGRDSSTSQYRKSLPSKLVLSLPAGLRQPSPPSSPDRQLEPFMLDRLSKASITSSTQPAAAGAAGHLQPSSTENEGLTHAVLQSKSMDGVRLSTPDVRFTFGQAAATSPQPLFPAQSDPLDSPRLTSLIVVEKVSLLGCNSC